MANSCLFFKKEQISDDEKILYEAWTGCRQYASLIGSVNIRRNSKLIRSGYYVFSDGGDFLIVFIFSSLVLLMDWTIMCLFFFRVGWWGCPSINVLAAIREPPPLEGGSRNPKGGLMQECKVGHGASAPWAVPPQMQGDTTILTRKKEREREWDREVFLPSQIPRILGMSPTHAILRIKSAFHSFTYLA